MYLGNQPKQYVKIDYVFSATEGQTVFSGTDINGLTLSFSPVNFDIIINGVMLGKTDVSAYATGTSFTLADARKAGDVVIFRSYGTSQQLDATINQSMMYGAPIGTVAYTFLSVAPDGWLTLNGQAVTVLYPDLRTMIINMGSPWGTLSGDPKLPNLITNGEFIRAGGPGGLAIGTIQTDDVKPHNHPINDPGHAHNYSQAYIPGPQGGSLTGSPGYLYFQTGTTTTNVTGITVQNSTGTETRPKNIALLPIIKAFGAVSTTGMADLATLLTAIASQAEAEAGTDNLKIMTPLRTKQAIDLALPAYNKWKTISFDTMTSVSSWSRTNLGAYKHLKLLSNIRVGAVTALLQLSSDNGSSWINSNYYYEYHYGSGAGSGGQIYTSQTSFAIHTGNVGGTVGPQFSNMTFTDFNQAQPTGMLSETFLAVSTTSMVAAKMGGGHSGSTAMNAMRITGSAAFNGDFVLEGILG